MTTEQAQTLIAQARWDNAYSFPNQHGYLFENEHGTHTQVFSAHVGAYFLIGRRYFTPPVIMPTPTFDNLDNIHIVANHTEIIWSKAKLVNALDPYAR